MRHLTWAVLVVLAAAACADGDEPVPATTTIVEGSEGIPASIQGLIDGGFSSEVDALGFVVVDQAGTRFCSALAESFPPQCGGPSLQLVDLDTAALELQAAEGVQWTDGMVVLRGRYGDGSFTVTGTGDDSGVASSQCVENDPDCQDTMVDAGDGPVASSGGMTVDGGLTVTEALQGQANGTSGVIAVRGHLYDDGTGPHLCEALTGGGERYTCGGQLLPLSSLNTDALGDRVVMHNGLTYTEEEITVLGELIDGVLVVDPTVS